MTANILAILLILAYLLTGYILMRNRLIPALKDPRRSYTLYAPPNPPSNVLVIHPDQVEFFRPVIDVAKHYGWQINVTDIIASGTSYLIDPDISLPHRFSDIGMEYTSAAFRESYELHPGMGT